MGMALGLGVRVWFFLLVQWRGTGGNISNRTLAHNKKTIPT